MKNLFQPNSFLASPFIFWRPAAENSADATSESTDKKEGLKVDEKAFTTENVQKLTKIYKTLESKNLPAAVEKNKELILNRLDELTGLPER